MNQERLLAEIEALQQKKKEMEDMLQQLENKSEELEKESERLYEQAEIMEEKSEELSDKADEVTDLIEEVEDRISELKDEYEDSLAPPPKVIQVPAVSSFSKWFIKGIVLFIGIVIVVCDIQDGDYFLKILLEAMAFALLFKWIK